MINYSPGNWGCCFLLQLRGSVLPKALVWAVPLAILAWTLHTFLREEFAEVNGADKLWSGYTLVLGLVLVCRVQQGCARFSEAAALLQQMRCEWSNAVGGVVAFCSQSEDKKASVREFQYLLVRLMSMLHSQALRQVCDLGEGALETIDLEGIDQNSLAFLSRVDDRCEVILQWLQRATLDAHAKGTLRAGSPILARVFQELSRGMSHLSDLRRIRAVRFPFPYLQVIHLMLIAHSLATPMLACHLVENRWCAAAVTLLVTSALWSLLYVSNEVDQPFGEGANDFDVAETQQALNRSLLALLHPLAQKAPTVVDYSTLPASMDKQFVETPRSAPESLKGTVVAGGTSPKALLYGTEALLCGSEPSRSFQGEAGASYAHRPLVDSGGGLSVHDGGEHASLGSRYCLDTGRPLAAHAPKVIKQEKAKSRSMIGGVILGGPSKPQPLDEGTLDKEGTQQSVISAEHTGNYSLSGVRI